MKTCRIPLGACIVSSPSNFLNRNTIIPKAIKDQLLSESINDIEIFKGKIAIYYYEHFYSNLVIQKILMKPIIEEKLTTIIDDPKQ